MLGCGAFLDGFATAAPKIILVVQYLLLKNYREEHKFAVLPSPTLLDQDIGYVWRSVNTLATGRPDTPTESECLSPPTPNNEGATSPPAAGALAAPTPVRAAVTRNTGGAVHPRATTPAKRSPLPKATA